jgi:hypothetical protein
MRTSSLRAKDFPTVGRLQAFQLGVMLLSVAEADSMAPMPTG